MHRCQICRFPAEQHHVKTRGSGGTDDEWNLLPLCRRHHSETHTIGLNRFGKKYPSVKMWLIANGWIFDDFVNKWRHE